MIWFSKQFRKTLCISPSHIDTRHCSLKRVYIRIGSITTTKAFYIATTEVWRQNICRSNSQSPPRASSSTILSSFLSFSYSFIPITITLVYMTSLSAAILSLLSSFLFDQDDFRPENYMLPEYKLHYSSIICAWSYFVWMRIPQIKSPCDNNLKNI